MDPAAAAGVAVTSPVSAAVLAASAAALAAGAVFLRRDRVLVRRVDGLAQVTVGPAPDPVWRLCARVGAFPVVRGLGMSPRLEQLLELAGWAGAADVVAGGKAVLAASLFLVALLGPVPLIAPVLAFAGFRFPDIVVARAARRRLVSADVELPQFLDVLAAASLAGLSGPLALRRATEAIRGPLADELAKVVRAVDLGGRWRDELRKCAARLGLPDLRRTVAALTRSESLGASLSEALSDLAEQVRASRRAAATERARKAPVKMLFPLVFLVLPAFLLLTVVPVLLTTLQSIR